MIQSRESIQYRHTIKVYAGDERLAETVLCEGDRKVFGRGEDCDVPLPIEDICLRHVEITVEEGTVFVRNLKKSGLWLNGALIQGREEFDRKDTLLLGTGGTTFLYEEAAPLELETVTEEEELTGKGFQAAPVHPEPESAPGGLGPPAEPRTGCGDEHEPTDEETCPSENAWPDIEDDSLTGADVTGAEITGDEVTGAAFTASGKDQARFHQVPAEPVTDATVVLDLDEYHELEDYDEVTEIMFPDEPEVIDDRKARIRNNRKDAFAELLKALGLMALIGSALWWFLHSRVLVEEK